MTGNVNPIPDGYRRVNACFIVDGAAKAIDFYTDVFGATERMRTPGPGDTIVHAELEIGDSIIMLEDASPFMGTQAPPAGGFEGSQEYHFIYVEDVDSTIDRAVKLGATLKRPATDQFYGDRDGYIIDPFGHGWVVGSHMEDVSGEEMAKRMNEMFGQG